LNGVAAETTNNCDRATSVWEAYRVMDRPWALAFAIRAALDHPGGAERQWAADDHAGQHAR